MYDLTRTRNCEPLFLFQRIIVTVFGLCLRVLILLGWCSKPIDRKHIDDVTNILKKGYQNIALGLACIAKDKLVCIGPQWAFKFLDSIGIRLYGFNSLGMIVINPEIFVDFDENKLIELQKTLIHEAGAVYGKSHDECIYLENIIPYSVESDASSFSKGIELECVKEKLSKRIESTSKHVRRKSFFIRSIMFFLENTAIRIMKLIRRRYRFNPQRVRRILINANCGIGDVIMQTPTIDILYRKFPQARIYALVNTLTFEVLKHNPNIFEMILCPAIVNNISRLSRITFLSLNTFKNLYLVSTSIMKILFKRIDLCVMDVKTSGMQGRLIAFFGNAKYRIGDLSRNSDLYFLNNENSRSDPGCHHILVNFAVLEKTGLVNMNSDELEGNNRPRIYITEEDRYVANEYLQRNGLINKRFILGFHPGSAGGRNIFKRWPEHKFIDLGIKLKSEFPDIPIVVFTGSHELQQTRNVAKCIDQAIVAEGMTLLQTAALIERCDLLVSNDSGLIHVASAVDTPVVGIYGPTNPDEIGPWGDIHSIVRTNLSCRNCYNHKYLEACNKAVWCMNNSLEVDEVFEVVRRKILTQLTEYGFANGCFVCG